MGRTPRQAAGGAARFGHAETGNSGWGLREHQISRLSGERVIERGLLIVLEGIDGTGKSTQCRLLAEGLRERGFAVKQSFEPTNGVYGRRLRESAEAGRLEPEEELELFLKDRKEHVEQLIRPALEAGECVVLDRYYFSTMAYQGSRGLDPGEIRRRNEEFAPVPDVLFILDLDVEVALGRVRSRGDVPNDFEREESLRRCHEIFASLHNELFGSHR